MVKYHPKHSTTNTYGNSWATAVYDYGLTQYGGSWYGYDSSDTSATSESARVIYVDRPVDNLVPGDRATLPDGSVIVVDDQGNYKIEDKNAVVTYKASNIRNFNPYINASDLLARFVGQVKELGVNSKQEVLNLPIKLFISWLVIEAAEQDGDEVPENVQKEFRQIHKPQCQLCGRYIKKLYQFNNFPFCDPAHASKHLKLLQAC